MKYRNPLRRLFASRARRTSLFLLLLCGSALGFGLLAQAARGNRAVAPPPAQDARVSPDGAWRMLERAALAGRLAPDMPERVLALRLEAETLERLLARAPRESNRPFAESEATITLPLPNGTFSNFRIEESAVLEPALAARFPEIKSYRGQSLDDPQLTMRADWTPQGFHALILGNEQTYSILPAQTGDTLNYVSFAGMSRAQADEGFACGVTEAFDIRPGAARTNAPFTSIGPTRRQYRIAVATTGEYGSTLGGGTLAGTIASINTWLNGVNAIYERELAIRLTMVNDLDVLYLNAATDPYANGSTVTMLSQVRPDLRDKVGQANFDVGHVLGTGGAGIAFVGVVCDNTENGGDGLGPLKGGGVSLLGGTLGNPNSTNVLAHELGHQFGANHSFNGTTASCSNNNRSAANAVEAGSGLTIMSYAGICTTDNIAGSPELRFHNHSFNQILSYVGLGGGACGTTTSTGNTAPTVNGGADRTIPKQTPFMLTATGNDTDSGDAANLTYAWEEVDIGNAFSNPPYTDASDGANSTRPIFRPYSPVPSPARSFPALNYILNNANTAPPTVNGLQTADSLPNVARTLNFRVTARDQRGGVNDDAVILTVASSGPFLVTAPNTNLTWTGGTQQTVTWSVNGTNNAPVSCANVSIKLSTDGGNTFPVTLLASTPNDGTQALTVPNGILTSAARIKVEASGNIFFDISDANFSVAPGDNCPAIGSLNPPVSNIGANVLITGVNFTSISAVKFSNNVTAQFQVLNSTLLTATVPAGASTGPITISKAGCADVQTANFTVCPSPPVTLQVDDGSLEQSIGFESGSLSSFVNRLTPSSYPATLSSIVAAINLPAGTPVELIYAANTDGDTNINGTVFQSLNTTVLSQGTFVSYNISPLTINAGDFVVGFRVAPAPQTFPATVDITAPSQQRSYLSSDGVNFSTLDANGFPGNLGLRAIVFLGNCGGGGAQCPTITNLDPTNGAIGSMVTISGTNFTDVNAVKFSNNVTAQFTVVNAMTITATVPSGAVTGPITISKDGCPDAQTQTFTVNCPTITISPTSLSAGTVNAAYNQAFTPSGGAAPYTFSLASGTLPNGLTLSAGGTLAGTPTQRGTFNFTARATDNNGCAGTQALTLVINCQTITINQTSLPAGTVNASYNQALTQTGAQGAVSWSIVAGTLPNGITLSTAGVLSGTPTQKGTFNITVRVTDVNGCMDDQALALVINCQTITVNPATLPTASVNLPYSQTITQTGGFGAVTLVLTGTLPNGLSFNASSGVLSGTPTQSGMFNIAVTATDANACTGLRNYTLTVNSCPAVTISPATLPNGTLNAAYNQTLSASGSTGPYTFAVVAGALPGGLALSTAGALTGTATALGSFSFTVRATSSLNCTGERAYTLVINCPTITVNPAGPNLPGGTHGTPYNQALSATGGVAPYNFAVIPGSGTLPPGLMLSTGGVISGTPTQGGAFSFAVSVSDNNNCVGSRAYNINITSNCPTITLSPATLPAGTTGTSYAQTVTASGGAGPYVFSVGAGTLPTGITFTSSGLLTGTPQQIGSFNLTLKATDINNCVGTRSYTLTINCGPITVNPPALANGFLGTAYNQTLTATSGAAPYSFTVSAGALPGGLSLATNGALTGTPAAAGTFNFTARATDSQGCTGTRQYTVIISGAGLMFYPLSRPVRLLDTRTGQTACFTPGVPIAGNTSLTQLARVTCDGLTIPAEAQAITGNITTVNSGGGFLTLYPSDVTRPPVASSNYAPNEIVNNVFTVGLGDADGAFKVYAANTTNVVIDVSGYYAPPNAGGLYFHPLPTVTRTLDTRPNQAGACDNPGAPLAGNTSRTQQGRGLCNGITIPNNALALVGNATVVSPTGAGYITLYPGNTPLPPTASGNYAGGDTSNTPFIVGLAPDGTYKIYTKVTTNLVVDVLGYYSPDAVDANGAGLLFNPLASPVRLEDTRPGQQACNTPGVPLTGGQQYTQMAQGMCGGATIPTTARAVVGNTTVVTPQGTGFLILWPSNVTLPLAAYSNYTAGQIVNRHFTVGLGADGAFKKSSSATTHLVTDLLGYFAP